MALPSNDTLQRLRAFLAERDLALNERLPPERELAVQLSVTRATLRKAMAVLEAEGQVWRHVGRGTFVGARPVLNLADVQYLSGITSRSQILEARLAVEPELARLAALNGINADFAEIALCHRRCSEARIWRMFESWDYRFHFAIAQAGRNKLLIALFETLNAVRRSLATARPETTPPEDHPSYAEHEAILAAIARREAGEAGEAMRRHLTTVRLRQLSALPVPDGQGAPSRSRPA